MPGGEKTASHPRGRSSGVIRQRRGAGTRGPRSARQARERRRGGQTRAGRPRAPGRARQAVAGRPGQAAAGRPGPTTAQSAGTAGQAAGGAWEGDGIRDGGKLLKSVYIFEYA